MNEAEFNKALERLFNRPAKPVVYTTFELQAQARALYPTNYREKWQEIFGKPWPER